MTLFRCHVDRLPYKKVLQQLVANNISLLDYPELRMYQLADADRISTFFRIEEESINLFESIEKLALDHLGVTKKNIFPIFMIRLVKINTILKTTSWITVICLDVVFSLNS